MNTSVEDSLTGRTRYRVENRLFRKTLVVLQVEARCDGWRPSDFQPGTGADRTYWRDARPEDFAFADRAPGLLIA